MTSAVLGPECFPDNCTSKGHHNDTDVGWKKQTGTKDKDEKQETGWGWWGNEMARDKDKPVWGQVYVFKGALQVLDISLKPQQNDSMSHLVLSADVYAYLHKNGGFPGSSDSKECACNAGDLDSIPELGRSPGEGMTTLQYSEENTECLENPHEQKSLVGWSPWSCKESDMTEQLSTAQHSHKMGMTTSSLIVLHED